MTLWLAIGVLVVGTYVLKLAGLAVPQRVLDHPFTRRVSDLIPVALLGALVAVQVLGAGSAVVLDARAVALVAAAIMLSLRMSFLPVVVGAALVAALVRALPF
ncbi:AzlD domain-containing protein [Aeromicrobium sp. IC_218]|uniref:AzlD domain-containing protein n=1 Tax=Aeromicrobium sp. IC_218 TaxID=2545468 RepID=UPI00103B5A0B|nr:AzlD domain-containing protein [Aeromicrobium sp. IC_218]TCJ00259.1 AzlD domain-containing protein [Aeromicrobium sp. IC_218]